MLRGSGIECHLDGVAARSKTRLDRHRRSAHQASSVDPDEINHWSEVRRQCGFGALRGGQNQFKRHDLVHSHRLSLCSASPDAGEPAVDPKNLSCDPSGVRTEQPLNGTSHIRRVADPPEGVHSRGRLE